jgi:hypothetical protein
MATGPAPLTLLPSIDERAQAAAVLTRAPPEPETAETPEQGEDAS